MQELQTKIEKYYTELAAPDEIEFRDLAKEFIDKLNSGTIRSAEPDGNGNWKVNSWVKQGIILLFRYGKLKEYSIDENYKFFDKDTLPLRPATLESGLRIVPGGSSIRTGCYVAKSVICMPPMYINIGSYIDEGSMVDSHALVGSCAQIGKRVHLSAAVQVGGVMEPPGARPVIIEDDVLVGGNCGVFEGVMVRKRAVLGSGVILTASTRVYDLVNEKIIKSDVGVPLEIPESAVLIPGSRSLKSDFAKEHGLSISTPMIIKYRDEKTDAKTALESALR
jgi:2,3,4,5-tetrahydropyridine-2-carboxylate N-succinyltransferase